MQRRHFAWHQVVWPVAAFPLGFALLRSVVPAGGQVPADIALESGATIRGRLASHWCQTTFPEAYVIDPE
jgi:hypothetical protein